MKTDLNFFIVCHCICNEITGITGDSSLLSTDSRFRMHAGSDGQPALPFYIVAYLSPNAAVYTSVVFLRITHCHHKFAE
jgi:hypothetical protein